MRFRKYRYRPVHAICEKVFELLAPLVSGVTGEPLTETPKKILILKFGGMGEAVLARSLVEHLRRRNPLMRFDFILEERTMEPMTCGGGGNSLIYRSGSDGLAQALSILRTIRRQHYDAILDFEQHSLLTAAFTRAAGIPVRVGFVHPGTRSRGEFLTHPIELRESESMWSAMVRMCQVIDPQLTASVGAVAMPYSPETNSWMESWWKNKITNQARGPVVAMHIGVGPSAQYRLWPMERWVQLASRLLALNKEMTVVLTGGTAEQPLMENFKLQFPGRTVGASDLGTFERSAALLERCDLLISCDTGIMHLGAAMGTPTVGLFGPNTPICWGPVGFRATYVYPTRQPCSPCINSYQRYIPARCTAIQQSACMWDISVDDVLAATRTVLRDGWV
ncbi:glycosyltransferase family 9 protein [Alloacidobacterium dinghuense]|uniref:Glycosyltransferase family 9 protein n=1 Tax=Alloacidobacterium dinghuense TaxID=2763107 RepID=A0A7G8BGB1_9BACT|nr:glycosyltransferase family 9 protein [Alloacidobacterium dinghuense]QNI31581.1 glycosyltransferase family 9 protein [Alloacidobacterium dinghuense]